MLFVSSKRLKVSLKAPLISVRVWLWCAAATKNPLNVGWRHLIQESYYCEGFLLNIHEPSLLHWWVTRLNLYDLINIYKPGVRNRMAINERQHDLFNIEQLSLCHSSICCRHILLCLFSAANWCTRGITVSFNLRTATLGFNKEIK